MIDTTVVVRCDWGAPEDDCPAEFEVLRMGIPDAMRALVENQLRLRGWTGTIPGRVTCPLHPADQPTEVVGVDIDQLADPCNCPADAATHYGTCVFTGPRGVREVAGDGQP